MREETGVLQSLFVLLDLRQSSELVAVVVSKSRAHASHISIGLGREGLNRVVDSIMVKRPFGDHRVGTGRSTLLLNRGTFLMLTSLLLVSSNMDSRALIGVPREQVTLLEGERTSSESNEVLNRRLVQRLIRMGGN